MKNANTNTENTPVKYFSFEGGMISHVTVDGKKTCCGSHVKFGEKKLEVKWQDGVIKEWWDDKWVTVNEWDYCKSCIKRLQNTKQVRKKRPQPKPPGRGGSRPGSGPKKKEKTVAVYFRYSEKKVNDAKENHPDYLEKLKQFTDKLAQKKLK